MGHYYDCPKCGYEDGPGGCQCPKADPNPPGFAKKIQALQGEYEERKALDTGSPQPDEVTRITNVIVENLGSCDLESALTVICNIGGQLVCAMAEGRPSAIQDHANNMAENMKKAAITKALHDTEKKRAN